MASSTSATTNLLDLPPELVTQVITESLPEGFESLALSCKAIHELCKPFIEHHNHLRAQFHNFTYNTQFGTVPRGLISCAYNLLERIAEEPTVARYIQHADLAMDSRVSSSISAADIERGGPIAALFASSPYLQDAGSDWKEYHALIATDYATINRDIRFLQEPRFSQHAAALVLTLLPNLKSLKLPHRWGSTDSSDKLINTVLSKARQSNTTQQQHGSSLAAVTSFRPSAHWTRGALPFLALPNLRSYSGPIPEAVNTSSSGDVLFGEKLETVYMCGGQGYQDFTGADFLRSATRLTTFEYRPGEHGPWRPDKLAAILDWDFCEFIHIIKSMAGDRLECLRIAPAETMKPGHIFLRGFQRLQKLVLPFTLFQHVISYAASSINKSVKGLTGTDVETLKVKLVDLVPASITQLVLQPQRRTFYKGDDTFLRIMFHDFRATQAARLPALKKIIFDCPTKHIPWGSHTEYKRACKQFILDNELIGIELVMEDHFRHNSEWHGR